MQSHTFVVPAYKYSPFLGECLSSLKRQTESSRILITTSTPSETINSVARSHQIAVIVNPVREGIAADWNFALNAAEARYVTLAHQDDVYKTEFLARTLDMLAQHDGAVCFTGYDEIDDPANPTVSKISVVKHVLRALTIGGRSVPSHRRMRAFLSLGNPLPCSSVTLDRARLPRFSFADSLESNLDWDAWWRLVDAGERFVSVSERLVGRRHNALTATARLIATGQRAVEDRLMFQRIWPRPIARVVASLYRLSY